MTSDLDGIRALLQRYARAVDSRDIDALAALFRPDARIVGSRGEQDLGAWLESMRSPRSWPVSMHVLGEPLVEFDPDGTSAQADTYAVVYQIADRAAGGTDLTLGIRYQDHLVRDGAGWVVASRRASNLWTR